ncbi:MAG: permease-like cell division protein FtsX [bacterium]
MNFIFLSSIAKELRIITRIIIETFKGINRTGLMNFVIISTIAAILSIFGCLFRTSLGISTFVQELGTNLEISVYLKAGADPQSVSQKILKIGNIEKINIITKDKAWENLKAQMDVPDIKNPLPNTLHIKVNNTNYVENVVNKIKQIKGVEGLQYPQQLARKVQKIGDITNIATIVVLIFLGGLTLFIISNTIHLVIQARKQEIEIMRMMGVSNWYIKSPYILQGAFYGLCGAVISMIPLGILQNYLNKFFNFFQVSTPAMNINIVILSLLMMGIIVGAGGSIISVRKYLRV